MSFFPIFINKRLERELSESEMNQKTVHHLTQRLIEVSNEVDVYRSMAYSAQRIALKCIEIYGDQATRKFLEDWKHLESRLKD